MVANGGNVLVELLCQFAEPGLLLLARQTDQALEMDPVYEECSSEARRHELAVRRAQERKQREQEDRKASKVRLGRTSNL